MSAPKIPPRNPISDTFEGVLLQVADQYLLAHAPLEGAQTVHSGIFTIRYGIVYLIEGMYSIVPGILALDYGEFLTGDEAWHFIFKKSNLHPRADVIGYRNDGEDDMVPLKRLDLEHPVDVLVYADADTTKPLATVQALINPQSAVVADRLRDHLHQFASLEAWKESNL